MLTKEGLNRSASRIAMMPFFPSSDKSARALLIEELGSICESDGHAEWLAIRMGQLFKKQWPGFGEMRALYCKRFRPRDGQETTSEIYIDGFPSEHDLGLLQIAGLPDPPAQLPQASPKMKEISASPEMQSLIAECAAAAAIPEPRKPRTLAEIEAELYKKHPVPTPKKKQSFEQQLSKLDGMHAESD